MLSLSLTKNIGGKNYLNVSSPSGIREVTKSSSKEFVIFLTNENQTRAEQIYKSLFS